MGGGGGGGGGGGVSSGDEKGCIGVDHNKNHLICLWNNNNKWNRNHAVTGSHFTVIWDSLHASYLDEVIAHYNSFRRTVLHLYRRSYQVQLRYTSSVPLLVCFIAVPCVSWTSPKWVSNFSEQKKKMLLSRHALEYRGYSGLMCSSVHSVAGGCGCMSCTIWKLVQQTS